MKGKAIVRLVLSGSLLLLTLTLALAAQRIPLHGGSDMRSAQGEALISDAAGGIKELAITAQGLEPNEVYTAWLVRMEPKMAMTGLKGGGSAFTSDAKGNGRYTGTVSATELGKWQQIKIAHHPDRNPRNMKNIRSALVGNLK